MNPAMTVRRLRERDIDRILVIELDSFGKDAYDRNLFAEFLHKCGSLFLVAESDGDIGGYAVACVRAAGKSSVRTAELISIAVHSRCRGRGIASVLLDSLLRRLRRRDVARLNLMVRVSNQAARSLYEKYGFRRVRIARNYYEDGGDGLLLTLALRPDC